MATTSSTNSTPLMQRCAAKLLREGSLQVKGLTGLRRVFDADGNLVSETRTQDRAQLRLFLEREAKRPVSLLHLGDTAIYELV